MKQIQLMLITSSPEIASYAEESGVGRIFLDMEVNGKNDRQKNLGLPLNQHSFQDVSAVKKALKNAEVMVRINPPFDGTKQEVDRAIDSGADCIMLPYFHHQDEVKAFVEAVDGRCKTNILLETATAVARANSILSVAGLDEVHVGLNDLKLTFKLDFLYETLAGGLVDHLSRLARENSLSFGVGGIGAMSIGADVDPAAILKQYVRLGSERVILSRAFTGAYANLEELKAKIDLFNEILRLRKVEAYAHMRSEEEKEADSLELFRLINRKALEKK